MKTAWSYIAGVLDEAFILAMIVFLWAVYRKEE